MADASTSQNPLSAKLTEVLGASYTDFGVRSALEALSEQFAENTPNSRRQLRTSLELRDLQNSGALLKEYEKVIVVTNILVNSHNRVYRL
jgi:hypothetical protein